MFLCFYLLCSPLFVPQITGLLLPPLEEVTENVSVRHSVAVVAPSPPALGAPFKIFMAVVIDVDGPVMTKVLKSKRNWQILLLQGQIVARQLPEATADDSK
jgi:hypothetical protein